MNKPRIVYLSDSSLEKQGGAQQSMKVLMDGINQAGNFEVFIISPQGEPQNDRNLVLREYGSFVLRKNKCLDNLKILWDIHRLIKKIDPHIVHVQMTSTLIIINALRRLGFLNRRMRIVWTDRGIYGEDGWLTTISTNSIVKEATKVITTTQHNQGNYARLFRRYDAYKDKFQVIHNTAGTKYTVYEDKQREKVRAGLGFEENTFVVGFCGRYSEQKDWPLAKRIIERCDKLNDRAFLVILGSDQTDADRQRIHAFIRELEEAAGKDKITALVDVDNDVVSDLYYAMDCFVLTSRWESFGRTAVEAMARKNMVVGTDVDGLSEVIGAKQFLYREEERAFQIIEEHYKDRDKLNESKTFFYNRYHELFSTKSHIGLYEQMYKDIFNAFF